MLPLLSSGGNISDYLIEIAGSLLEKSLFYTFGSSSLTISESLINILPRWSLSFRKGTNKNYSS